MFSNYPIAQPVPKPIIASPFFMFLSDQQKATKAQNTDIKLLDLAANAIKEWDQVMNIQDEYTAKFLQESENIQSGTISNPQTLLRAQPEIKSAFDLGDIPPPPKRPLSPFFLFKADMFAQVKAENPNLQITGITRLIAERWSQVDQQTLQYYAHKTAEAKLLYEQQIAQYEAMYGKIEKKPRKPPGGSNLFQTFQPSDSDE